jgi:hypothetical protein
MSLVQYNYSAAGVKHINVVLCTIIWFAGPASMQESRADIPSKRMGFIILL